MRTNSARDINIVSSYESRSRQTPVIHRRFPLCRTGSSTVIVMTSHITVEEVREDGTPVSYTHLDVYKRQPDLCREKIKNT